LMNGSSSPLRVMGSESINSASFAKPHRITIQS
jgi:hypothetical protein